MNWLRFWRFNPAATRQRRIRGSAVRRPGFRGLPGGFAGTISLFLFALVSIASAVERFDDVVIAPQSMTVGETHHGYREFRVLLENQSATTTHVVQLIIPDRDYGMGGHVISRLSRSVSLGPFARASVPLWQPPLPMDGNTAFKVVVDDEEVGIVNLPGSVQHVSRSSRVYGMAEVPTSILVSRSFNFDEAGRALKAESGKPTFSASAAIGPSDAGTGPRRGAPTGFWMPDPSRPGPHWIELDYDPPVASAGELHIYDNMGTLPAAEVILTGVSGANLARIPILAAGPRVRRSSNLFSFPLAAMAEPIKTVRLEFTVAPAGVINIDAVALEVSPGTNVWATAARASSEAIAPPMSTYGIPGTDPRELLRAEGPLADWSEYWLSYTPYDAITLTAADLKSAPAAVQSALWRYTECGGNLILLGGGEVPESWRSFPKTALDGGQCWSVGFGKCFIFDSDRLSALKPAAIKSAMDKVAEASRYWRSLPDQNGANATFQVVDSVRIPVRGIVFVMLAFVLLIGPVNLIVLSRLNRRTWLLWTIPAISLVTCLVVFVYSLFAEGITPDVRTEGLTVLDQVNHRAASVGNTAFYCPLTPSQGLFFEPDTEATPLVDVATMYRHGRQSGTKRELDWSRSQHLQRGWVTARVPAHFHLRKSDVRRERLQVDHSGGVISVVNGLAAPIRSLVLADDEGQIYTATNIGLGQKATLTAATGTGATAGGLGVPSFLDRPGTPLMERFSLTNVAGFLLPNTYAAELDANPFLENGLGPKAASARNKQRCLIYGLLEPARRP